MSLMAYGMDKLLHQYIDYCRYERAFSALTCEYYEADCRHFMQYLNMLNIPYPKITTLHIQQWLMSSHASGKSPRTLSRALAALRGFFGFCVKQGFFESNPAVGIKVP